MAYALQLTDGTTHFGYYVADDVRPTMFRDRAQWYETAAEARSEAALVNAQWPLEPGQQFVVVKA